MTDQFPGRPILSDFYAISQTKLLEHHTLHSGTYLFRILITKSLIFTSDIDIRAHKLTYQRSSSVNTRETVRH